LRDLEEFARSAAAALKLLSEEVSCAS